MSAAFSPIAWAAAWYAPVTAAMLASWLDVPIVNVFPVAPASCTSFLASARFWLMTGALA